LIAAKVQIENKNYTSRVSKVTYLNTWWTKKANAPIYNYQAIGLRPVN